MMTSGQGIGGILERFERDIAENRGVRLARFLCLTTCGKIIPVLQGSSKFCNTNSLYRYPSPNRPACSPSRSITVFCRHLVKTVYDIGYHSDLGFYSSSDNINCDVKSKTTIGLRLCKRHQSSLRQLQYSVWQVASITTWSAAWPAQVRALWLQNCLAQTVQVQWLSVRQLAYSVTTRAFAANLDNCALAGRITFRNRGQGASLAAVF